MSSRHGSLALVAAAFAALSGPSAHAQRQDCGPIIVAGHDADDHGFAWVYAPLFDNLLANVANGRSGILAIGADPGSTAAQWIQTVASMMARPQTVTFVNDANISLIDFSLFAILHVPSDNLDTVGGISQAEADLLTQRQGDVAVFQGNGGGLFGLTQGELVDGWAWIGGIGSFTHLDVPPSGTLPSGFLFDNVAATTEGGLLGITDTNLDGCCFHNVFTSYPSWLRILARADEPTDPAYDRQAVFLGGINTCILRCPVLPDAVAGPPLSACAGQAVTLDGSASTGCSAAGLSYRWVAGTTEICGWSTNPTCAAVPSGSTTYRLEVRCLDRPDCVATDLVTADVAPPPAADLAPLPVVCAGAPIEADASASSQPACLTPLEFQFRDGGGTVLQPWSTDPTYGPVPATAGAVFTVEVRCPDAPDCLATASAGATALDPPRAALAPLPAVCAGSSVLLDATASVSGGCPGPLDYRFFLGAVPLGPASSAPTFGPFVPAASGTFRVEVDCPAVTGCADSAEAALTVVPPATAVAGPDPRVCAGTSLVLTGAGSSAPGCPGAALYEWWEGATLLRPADPDPIFVPDTTTPGTRTYTLVVRCPAPPSCPASDEVAVTVRACPLAVRFGDVAAEVEPASAKVTVRWSTLHEDGTLAFQVERAPAAAGPFQPAGNPVEARGSGSVYAVVDPAPFAQPSVWYRIVELLDSGRGDLSPAVEARRAGAAGAAGAARRRTRAVRSR